MRPVNKGAAPRSYDHWDDAREDLRVAIGKYCSYCEMKLTHMPAVEHVVPRDQGGAPTDWENFLFSCVHCNSRKQARNPSRTDYLWPDQNNTHLAFDYKDAYTIVPSTQLSAAEQTKAEATIELCGLDKNPTHPKASKKDERWVERDQTWEIAKDNLENWRCAPSPAMAKSIANAAVGHGHFSIWLKVFEKEPDVRRVIIESFPGTSQGLYDLTTTQPVRHAGRT